MGKRQFNAAIIIISSLLLGGIEKSRTKKKKQSTKGFREKSKPASFARNSSLPLQPGGQPHLFRWSLATHAVALHGDPNGTSEHSGTADFTAFFMLQMSLIVISPSAEFGVTRQIIR